jgi:hypothetical protein
MDEEKSKEDKRTENVVSFGCALFFVGCLALFAFGAFLFFGG